MIGDIKAGEADRPAVLIEVWAEECWIGGLGSLALEAKRGGSIGGTTADWSTPKCANIKSEDEASLALDLQERL